MSSDELHAGLLTSRSHAKAIVFADDPPLQKQWTFNPDEEPRQGATAVVYQVRSLEDRSQVKALKVFRAGTEPSQSETDVIDRLADAKAPMIPHNVRLARLKADDRTELATLLMPWCDDTLRSWHERVAPPPEDDVQEYARHVQEVWRSLLTGFEELHERVRQNDLTFVHYDLKPENIGVQSAVHGAEFCLLDFGSASGTRGEAVQSATKKYAAPEVLAPPNEGSVASDLYSFGRTLEEHLEPVTNWLEQERLAGRENDVFRRVQAWYGGMKELYKRLVRDEQSARGSVSDAVQSVLDAGRGLEPRQDGYLLPDPTQLPQSAEHGEFIRFKSTKDLDRQLSARVAPRYRFSDVEPRGDDESVVYRIEREDDAQITCAVKVFRGRDQSQALWRRQEECDLARELVGRGVRAVPHYIDLETLPFETFEYPVSLMPWYAETLQTRMTKVRLKEGDEEPSKYREYADEVDEIWRRLLPQFEELDREYHRLERDHRAPHWELSREHIGEFSVTAGAREEKQWVLMNVSPGNKPSEHGPDSEDQGNSEPRAGSPKSPAEQLGALLREDLRPLVDWVDGTSWWYKRLKWWQYSKVDRCIHDYQSVARELKKRKDPEKRYERALGKLRAQDHAAQGGLVGLMTILVILVGGLGATAWWAPDRIEQGVTWFESLKTSPPRDPVASIVSRFGADSDTEVEELVEQAWLDLVHSESASFGPRELVPVGVPSSATDAGRRARAMFRDAIEARWARVLQSERVGVNIEVKAIGSDDKGRPLRLSVKSGEHTAEARTTLEVGENSVELESVPWRIGDSFEWTVEIQRSAVPFLWETVASGHHRGRLASLAAFGDVGRVGPGRYEADIVSQDDEISDLRASLQLR